MPGHCAGGFWSFTTLTITAVVVVVAVAVVVVAAAVADVVAVAVAATTVSAHLAHQCYYHNTIPTSSCK